MQTDLLVKFCTVCKMENTPHALVCVRCGNLFNFLHYNENDETTKNIANEHTTNNLTPPKNLKSPLAGLAFFLFGRTEIFALFNKYEICIGRMEIEVSEAFLDLTRVDGFQMGVSRRHALIHWQRNRAEIMDLQSSNGTFIDGTRILTGKFYNLKSGNVIQFGRLKLVVIFNEHNPML